MCSHSCITNILVCSVRVIVQRSVLCVCVCGGGGGGGTIEVCSIVDVYKLVVFMYCCLDTAP